MYLGMTSPFSARNLLTVSELVHGLRMAPETPPVPEHGGSSCQGGQAEQDVPRRLQPEPRHRNVARAFPPRTRP